MKENETNKNQSSSHKKSYHLRYIISVVILLLIIAALMFSFFNWEQKSDPASEKVIREAAAVEIYRNNFVIKDPNDLNDDDFAKIKYLDFSMQTYSTPYRQMGDDITRLSDIKLLEKFTNLEKLVFGEIRLPEVEIPKWMEILAKLGIYDLDKKFVFDLSPLKKLHNLQYLVLCGRPVKNIEPLASLNNLTGLNLICPVSDLNPLKNLTNLQHLSIQGTQVSDIKPLTNLPNLTYLMINKSPVTNLEVLKELKNLQKLCLWQLQITDLEFVKGLTNLEIFEIEGLPVSNLEPIKSMINLQYLYFTGCQNITIEEIEDLQKALSKLKIIRK